MHGRGFRFYLVNYFFLASYSLDRWAGFIMALIDLNTHHVGAQIMTNENTPLPRVFSTI